MIGSSLGLQHYNNNIYIKKNGEEVVSEPADRVKN